MLLVAQVYAPTDRDRTLYIFACNNRECSLQSSAWVVVRNQAPIAPAAADEQVVTVPPSSTPASASSVWTALGSGGLDDEGDDMDDLLALLDARDTTHASPTAVVKGDAPTPCSSVESGGEGGGANLTLRSPLVGLQWPARQLLDEEEYYESRGGDADSDDEGWLGRTAASDVRVADILRDYLQSEDDPAVLRALEVEGVSLSCEDGASTVRIAANTDSTMDDVGTADGAAERHLAGKPSAGAERTFQRRVSVCPTQCLRYAYGGKPLWCTSPCPAGAASVAPCDACGATRVFEMQLMPAALAMSLRATPVADTPAGTDSVVLSSEDVVPGEEHACAEPIDPSHPQLTLEALCATIDDAGLDYGVVAIYVCPSSCALGVQETVVVQNPPDISNLR
jgi:pre-rRNA-processing protein TSR4